ncbi:hypothetical protein RRG08_000623 [Elysia crispata]|uniref:Uncharacterized protein n=1 Tax=Elysia crispata TaxID=231223 RepID=A0AAE0Y8F7_9GAST|nr:hypothetical protein RRG08_000623 [Elysia crispata]
MPPTHPYLKTQPLLPALIPSRLAHPIFLTAKADGQLDLQTVSHVSPVPATDTIVHAHHVTPSNQVKGRLGPKAV